jgi:hypothetical protein
MFPTMASSLTPPKPCACMILGPRSYELDNFAQFKLRPRQKISHGNAGVWKAWKAKKPAFHPSHTPWKSLRGFPHYHGFDYDYHVSKDRQSPPKTRNQSHSRRKGLVNHVPGLKRKGCPGTLTPLSRFCFCCCFSEEQGRRCGQDTGPQRWGSEDA